MKRYFLAAFVASSIALYPLRAAAQAAAVPAAADQSSALQGEAIPAPGQPARGGRGGRGGGATPNAVQLTDDQLAQLHAKLDQLNAAIKALKDAKVDDDLIVDAESCGWIVETTLRIPNSYGDSDSPTNPFSKCMSSLNAGLRRAQQIKDGTAAWPQIKGSRQTSLSFGGGWHRPAL